MTFSPLTVTEAGESGVFASARLLSLFVSSASCRFDLVKGSIFYRVLLRVNEPRPLSGTARMSPFIGGDISAIEVSRFAAPGPTAWEKILLTSWSVSLPTLTRRFSGAIRSRYGKESAACKASYARRGKPASVPDVLLSKLDCFDSILLTLDRCKLCRDALPLTSCDECMRAVASGLYS